MSPDAQAPWLRREATERLEELACSPMGSDISAHCNAVSLCAACPSLPASSMPSALAVIRLHNLAALILPHSPPPAIACSTALRRSDF